MPVKKNGYFFFAGIRFANGRNAAICWKYIDKVKQQL